MSASFDRLVEVLKRLRAPDGCPWDRKQTFDSLQKHIVEESFELVDALAHREDEGYEPVIEECGDVAMQVAFLGCMAEEQGLFTMDQVLDGVCEKLIRRHPHVFGDKKAADEVEALARWEKVKEQERAGTEKGLFSGVPRSLPALLKAYRLQDKAAHVGFDWPAGDLTPVLGKVAEEFEEVKEALATGDDVEGELGDLMFAVVNLIRLAGFEPDKALNRTNQKFIDRLEKVESVVRHRGGWEHFNLQELDELWEQAKKDEQS